MKLQPKFKRFLEDISQENYSSNTFKPKSSDFNKKHINLENNIKTKKLKIPLDSRANLNPTITRNMINFNLHSSRMILFS
jgi:hypothetical protein